MSAVIGGIAIEAPELTRLRVLTTKALAYATSGLALVYTFIAQMAGNNALGVFLVGAAAAACMIWQAARAPSSRSTRYMAAAALAVDMMLSIYAAHGTPDGFMLDGHMIFFIFNAFLVFYFCWRTLLLYNALVGVHHIFLTFLLPFQVWPSDHYSLIHLINHVLLLCFQLPPLLFLAVHLSKVFNKSFMATCTAQRETETAQKLAQEVKRQAAAADAESCRNEEIKAKASAQQSFVVQELAVGLQSYAAGDMTCRLKRPLAPDYEQLRVNFNEAMVKGESSLRAVLEAIRAIDSSASEISQASDDLASRTEQQAVRLEETTAALRDITGSVHKTAEGTTAARRIVSTTRLKAEKGSEVARQATAAMGEIENASKRINQIIGVINDIAFQTNLLALNAGVEAARAGESGRGFAVVASEVRALAQRSAEAAKEIKDLILASSQQVGKGVELVAETGFALKCIFSEVAEIDNAVSQISQSTQEEATGLSEISSAVGQMDQMTQQNAAMVEQSTAACHTLAREMQELTRLIGKFRISNNVPSSAWSNRSHLSVA